MSETSAGMHVAALRGEQVGAIYGDPPRPADPARQADYDLSDFGFRRLLFCSGVTSATVALRSMRGPSFFTTLA